MMLYIELREKITFRQKATVSVNSKISFMSNQLEQKCQNVFRISYFFGLT